MIGHIKHNKSNSVYLNTNLTSLRFLEACRRNSDSLSS